MSSPSPGPGNLTGAAAAAAAAAAGILGGGGSRRVSTGFMGGLNSITGSGSNIQPSRSLTPPMGPQHSPNSFLTNLSSRLIQSRAQRGPLSGGIGNSTSGLPDIFDTAALSGPGNNFLAGFRTGSTSHGFGGGGHGLGPPSSLDLTEFPSLGGNSIGNVSLLSHGSAPGSHRPPYVGMVKDNNPTQTSTNEFTIHSEDFPALPGSNSNIHLSGLSMDSNSSIHNSLSSSGGIIGSQSVMNQLSGSNVSYNSGCIGGPHLSHALQGQGGGDSRDSSGVGKVKRGIQTSKDGRVTNIPPGLVIDQFGMIGLLQFIRAAESDQSMVSLALGTDLTTLGLNLNSSENLHSSFPGPWSDSPLKPHEIDFPVPPEYLINLQTRDKLAPIKLSRYGEDLLFFMFYMFPNDLIQLAASNELYTRDWRYHKDEKLWITRAPGMPPIDKTERYERGTYYAFDPMSWRRVAKEFHVDYDRLEARPGPPDRLGPQGIP